EIQAEASNACFGRLPRSMMVVRAASQRDAGRKVLAVLVLGTPQLNIGAVSDQNICFGPSTRTFVYPRSRSAAASRCARIPVLQYVTSGAVRSSGNASANSSTASCGTLTAL